MRRHFASAAALLALSALSPALAQDAILKPNFEPTTIKGVFVEQFGSDWSERWTPSEATKKTPVGGETFSYVGKWSVEEPTAPLILGDTGLVAKSKASHHAISAPLASPLDFAKKNEPLVVQYEAKFQKGGNCGGGYVKLLEDGFQHSGQEFSDKTPWVIMFGPDLTCPGTKVHFIIRHENPVTHEFEEKHLKSPPTPRIAEATVLYTLILNPDNTYEILVDDESSVSGSLLEDFQPPFNPPAEITDPDDKKPSDWVDTARIPDPDATKPEDWDEDAPYMIPDEEAEVPEGWLPEEPEEIPDPEAEKPEEWDDEEDGDWVAPTVKNPKCEEAPGCGEWKRPNKRNPDWKGKWTAAQVDNPLYLGPWEARKIPNPAYFLDENPFRSLRPIGGIGFEIWTMTEDILFDNIYIGHSPSDAKLLAQESFYIKKDIEKQIVAGGPPKKDAAAAEEEEEEIVFSEDPVGFVRQQVLKFVESAKVDPIGTFKSKPEIGAVIVAGILTLFGMLGAIFGLVGGAQKPVVSKSKKVDAPTKVADSTPTAPAGDAKTEESTGGAKKRAGK